MPEGLSKAIAIADHTLRKHAVYRAFVRARGYKNPRVSGTDDFFRLPITAKHDYLIKSGYKKFLETGVPPVAYASSGSSGNPTFWFRDQKQEIWGGRLHQKLFTKIYGIKPKDSTLVIICFSMGVWVAGNYTAACCRWIAEQGFNLTTITPGIEKADVLKILKFLAPNYQNVILAGYPSFVMDILTECRAKKIKFSPKTKLLTSGDSFSEDWRDEALNLLGGAFSPERIVGVYGSADAGIMGFETPLSIKLRRAALKHHGLYNELFGPEKKLPALFQFEPNHIFFESINHELVLTADTAIPLIRYNIHDVGKVISFNKTKEIYKKFKLGLPPKAETAWRLPVLVKKGRTDVAVTFYALNIYPEHIDAGIKHPALSKLLSGNFRAYNQINKNQKEEELVIELELKESAKTSKTILKKVSGIVAKNLSELNTEYRKLHSSLGTKALPTVRLVKKLEAKQNNIDKILLSIKGKKPRMAV